MKHNTFKLALAAVACLSAFSFAQIPLLEITTKDRMDPSVTEICTGQNFNGWCMGSTSTNMNYVGVTNIKLSNSSFNFDISSATNPTDSIRLRGNSTAGMDKKPYRIKFGTKRQMFGRTAAKSWVLLANYFDATFALNAIAFRLGQKMGLDFTPHSEFVELKINGSNKGIYQLTEQIQVNPGRVDIRDKKDWLVEFDYHPADADEIKFNTRQYSLPTFIKSPEVESQFNENNPTIKFVIDELNVFTNKMSENNFPNNGYQDMIDLESWVKYVLIQQLMDNFDFNSKIQDAAPGSNFAYRDSTGKIKAGPLWDFDLAAGLQGGNDQLINANFPIHYKTHQEPVEPKHAFYKRLWSDPAFKAGIKVFFDKHKSDIDAIPTFVDSISRVLESKAVGNIWNNDELLMSWGMGGATHGPLTKDKFESEVKGLKDWWAKRVDWFGEQIANFDKSKWIEQTATVTVTFDANGGTPAQTTQTVVIGAKATKPSNPTRSGCTFDDWYTDGGSSTGTFQNKWNFNDAVNGKMTLYAKWNGNNCSGINNPPPPDNTNFTVTFNTQSNSAQPTPAAQTVAKGSKATEPAAMTRQPAGQWIFAGWCKEQALTTLWDFNIDVVNADVYLYAKWRNATSPTYTVTFNANGGSGVATQTVEQGGKASSPNSARSGYVLDGWYKEAALTNAWNFATTAVNANTTLYAKWSTATSIATGRKLPLGNFTAIKNGFVVNVANNMSMTVFNLNGKVVRQQTLASGNHTIMLGDLPKGMYIVKASFGAGTTPVTLRMPIR